MARCRLRRQWQGDGSGDDSEGGKVLGTKAGCRETMVPTHSGNEGGTQVDDGASMQRGR